MALEELLASCGFALAPTAQPALLGAGIAGDGAALAPAPGACHAHLQGEAEPAAQPAAALVLTPEGRLELIMERTDIHERWHMSVLRERLIRQLAAAVGAVAFVRGSAFAAEIVAESRWIGMLRTTRLVTRTVRIRSPIA